MRGELVDAAARAKADPKLYTAPSEFELKTIKPGDEVKLGITFPPAYSHISQCKISEEKFWVKVDKRDGNKLIGTIQTEMEFFDQHDLVEFEAITFELRHIMASK